MTSGAILPTVGPSPPEFRRSFVPEHLRPKSLGDTAQDSSAPAPSVRPVDTEERSTPSNTATTTNSNTLRPEANGQNVGVSLTSASAVAVQIKEGREQQAELPPAPKREPLAGELTEEEKAEVKRLQERDREVRAHEAAHASVGRGFTGVPSYEYVTGPDGVRYAVGGHVDIDISEVPDDPAATIAKMEVVRAAALAPSSPSGQDRAVAAAAAAKAREAQAELNEQRKEELEETLQAKEEPENGSFAPEGNQPSNLNTFSLVQRSESGQIPPSQPVSINLLV